MPKDIIEVKNLKKSYKVDDIFDRMKGEKIKVGVNDVSFDVKEGEVFSIIGLNGAGKSTIMKAILGIIKPEAGTVKVFGKDKLNRKDYYQIGYLPEISYYPKDIKLKTLLNYYADLYNMKDKRKKIMESLDILGIASRVNDKLEKFSKGMVQRVGIVQAIMNKPKLLFLDEPMSGLDPLGRVQIMELIKDLKSNGTTIVLNTHILSDVEKIGDRIAVVDKGYIKEVIDMKDKKIDFGENFEIITNSSHDGFEEANGVYKKLISGENLSKELKTILDKKIEINSVKEKTVSLESYFMNIIKKEQKKEANE
jgi:ABC-2 type transport system ATP-binding protein